jgi:glutaredoxin
MKWRRLLTILAVVVITAAVALSFVGCGNNATTSNGGNASTSTTQQTSSNTAGGENVSSAQCPPQRGLVIFGTEGCPHCRALKGYATQVFGKGGMCFVEVNPGYGATKDAQEFFAKIYKEAYPGIPENQMGVPLAFYFYKGNVRGVFVGELPEKSLQSLDNYIQTATKPISIILWNGQAYELSATQAQKLTEDIKGFFQSHK